MTIGEGWLYLDKTSAPTIRLREAASATDYSELVDNGIVCYLRKVPATGTGQLRISVEPQDGTSDATIQMFRDTDTAGQSNFYIHVGDGSSTVAHAFRGDTATASVCQQGGSFTSGGNYFCDKTADPSLYLREGGSATSYLRLTDNGAVATIYKYEPTACTLRLDSLPGDGTSTATAEFFRTTNTSGTVQLLMRKGNNSTTIAHALYGGSAGSAELCREGIGNLTIGASGGGARLTVAGGDVRIDNTYSYQCENSSNSPIDVLGMDASNIIGVGNASYRPVIKSTDVVRIAAGNSVPADAVLSNGEVAFSIDETGNNLLVKVKYSTGTVKTGTVCALT